LLVSKSQKVVKSGELDLPKSHRFEYFLVLPQPLFLIHVPNPNFLSLDRSHYLFNRSQQNLHTFFDLLLFILKQSIIKRQCQLFPLSLLIQQPQKRDALEVFWRGFVELAHELVDVAKDGGQFGELLVAEEVLGVALGLPNSVV